MEFLEKNYDVVILTYMPKDTLIFLLQMLFLQSILPTQIIIINTDEKVFYQNISNKVILDNLLKDDKIMLKHIDKNKFDHGATRNYGASFCKSKYILFMTSDAIPYDTNLAINFILGFSNNIAVSNARQVARPSAFVREKIIREINYPKFNIVKDITTEKKYGIKNYYCSNVCAMYDLDVFIKNGGFEENIILNEDTYYAYKIINAGYKIIYNSKAIVYHSHNYSFRQQFSRNFDIGVSQAEKKFIFDKINVKGIGVGFAKEVILKLLFSFNLIELLKFIIECFYRYLGYMSGKKYKKLSNDKCIKFASNKDYFKKGKYVNK